MPIVNQHQPPAAYVAGLAQYAGAGQAAERRRAEALQLLQMQQQQQQFGARQQQAQQQMFLDEQFRRGRAVQDQQQFDARLQFAGEQDALRFEQGQQQMQQQADLQAERDNRQAELRRQGLEEDFTFRQKQDLARLSEAENQVKQQMAAGDMPPQVGQAYLDQIFAQRSGIQPVTRPAEQSPWPEGRGVGEVWDDDSPNAPGKKNIWTRDHNGNAKLIESPSAGPQSASLAEAFTPEVHQRLWKDAMEASRGFDAETGRATAPDPNEAMRSYQESVAAYYQSRKMIEALEQKQAIDQQQQLVMNGMGAAGAGLEAGSESPAPPMSELDRFLNPQAGQSQGGVLPPSPQPPTRSGQLPRTAEPVPHPTREGVDLGYLPIVQSESDLGKVPDGSYFVDPNGAIRRKERK